jgi:hypothetical protein
MKIRVGLFVAVFAALIAAAPSPSPSPTPAGVAFQYDQITRLIAPGASAAPSPGFFQADFDAAMRAAPDPSANLFSALFSGQPKRYTFYDAKGWMRIDDLINKTATIAKCDEHTLITLDLVKKTYTERDDVSHEQACPGDSIASTMPTLPLPAASQAPGTEDFTISTKLTNLGAQAIDGVATNGTQIRTEMSATNATGSCHNLAVTSTAVIYVADFGRPGAELTNLTPKLPAGMTSGCKPSVHITADAPALNFKPNDTAMYMLITSSTSIDGRSVQIGLFTERGHVAWLSQGDAEALFAIPADFTKR